MCVHACVCECECVGECVCVFKSECVRDNDLFCEKIKSKNDVSNQGRGESSYHIIYIY